MIACAVLVMKIATGEAAETKPKNAAAVEWGKGGQKYRKARAAAMTKALRVKSANRAAASRWKTS